jgi:hypothetical protein
MSIPLKKAIRRAYILGYRRAMRTARRELHEMADKLDSERHEMTRALRARLDAELASLRSDVRALGAEVDRRRAIDRSVVAEHSETTLLN